MRILVMILYMMLLTSCASSGGVVKKKLVTECKRETIAKRRFKCVQRLAQDFSDSYTLESIVKACERILSRKRK